MKFTLLCPDSWRGYQIHSTFKKICEALQWNLELCRSAEKAMESSHGADAVIIALTDDCPNFNGLLERTAFEDLLEKIDSRKPIFGTEEEKLPWNVAPRENLHLCKPEMLYVTIRRFYGIDDLPEKKKEN